MRARQKPVSKQQYFALASILILAGIALVLNSPWVVLSLTSGTGDCLVLVTHGVTTCIPGSPGKSMGCYYVVYKLYILS